MYPLSPAAIFAFNTSNWAALNGRLAAPLEHLAQRIAGKEEHGLAVDSDVLDANLGSGWVFAGKAYADLRPPLTQVEDDEMDSWAKKNGGTPDAQVLSLIFRGKSDKTVLVKRLEPKAECRPSSVGVYVQEPPAENDHLVHG
ncbi:hypothetical protein ACFYS7_34070 [Streptomyces avermitilis]|uniref:hypothetical protein n=1 Tax=Streptomyces avermitilis TaxID=33903 RepID=UPI0036CB8F37